MDTPFHNIIELRKQRDQAVSNFFFRIFDDAKLSYDCAEGYYLVEGYYLDGKYLLFVSERNEISQL